MKGIKNDNVVVQTSMVDVFNNWIKNANSEHTKVAYRTHVTRFFDIAFNKKIEDVTDDDLKMITPIFVDVAIKDVLIERGLQKSTINQMLKVSASYFKQLSINRMDSDINFEHIIEISLAPNLKDDGGTTTKMSQHNLETFKKWLIETRFTEGRYQELGRKYSEVTDLLWNTGSRVSAIFNIKWSDFIYEEDSLGQFGYNLHVFDKGAKHNVKPISDEQYKKLREEFFDGDETSIVFKGLSQQGFRKVLGEFGDLIGKKFTPHSIKKGAVSALYFLTKDLEMVRRFADHEDVKTTLGYIEIDNDRTQHGSFILSSKRASKKDLENLSKEELLSIITETSDLMQVVYFRAGIKGLLENEGDD